MEGVSDMNSYIPDPIEMMENNIEHMIDEWDGESCMACGKKVEYALVSLNARPDSPAVCYECLSPEDQKHYISFEK